MNNVKERFILRGIKREYRVYFVPTQWTIKFSLIYFALKDLKKIEEMKKNWNYLMLIYRRNGANNDAVIKESLRIDCGHLVRSVNFSLIANLQKSTAFWPRTAQYKDFFLITGHSSGRIRLWDVLSGNSLIIQWINGSIKNCFYVKITLYAKFFRRNYCLGRVVKQ
jgi:hypothetical protein